MAGRKYFTNATQFLLRVTLYVRASEDPRTSSGTKEFALPAGQARWEEYGNNVDIYLNSIMLSASGDGAPEQRDVVIKRGSPLDNMLNMNNGVDFNAADGVFTISTRQVS